MIRAGDLKAALDRFPENARLRWCGRHDGGKFSGIEITDEMGRHTIALLMEDEDGTLVLRDSPEQQYPWSPRSP